MGEAHQYRIVIADDDLGLRTLLGTMFGLEPDFEVLAVVEDGTSLLTAVDEAVAGGTTPDAVLLDLALPGMSGIEVARELAIRHPAVHVVIHTGRPIDDARSDLGDIPVMACIEKGARVDRLTGRVRELCDAAERQRVEAG